MDMPVVWPQPLRVKRANQGNQVNLRPIFQSNDMANTRPNPYPGPRSFQQGERLYGREHETAELLDLLIAERIVLLYSPSGAGKTSLVQAALIPELAREGFRVLPIMRPGLIPAAPGANSANRYILSLLLSLEKDLPEAQQTPLVELAGSALIDYLEHLPRRRPQGGTAMS